MTIQTTSSVLGHVKLIAVAGLLLLSSVLVSSQLVEAGPVTTCPTAAAGCTKVTLGQYRFDSSDSDLRNNHYLNENCAPCPDSTRVYHQVSQWRFQSAAYVRYCRYNLLSYSAVGGWLTTRNVWASTSSPSTSSLRFRTSPSC